MYHTEKSQTESRARTRGGKEKKDETKTRNNYQISEVRDMHEPPLILNSRERWDAMNNQERWRKILLLIMYAVLSKSSSTEKD